MRAVLSGDTIAYLNGGEVAAAAAEFDHLYEHVGKKVLYNE